MPSQQTHTRPRNSATLANPILVFLDIKSAYDTVDRNIIWRELETRASAPLLGILRSLFDDVSIQVLLSGATSQSFSPATGVLQGSILSPHLYYTSIPFPMLSVT